MAPHITQSRVPPPAATATDLGPPSPPLSLASLSTGSGLPLPHPHSHLRTFVPGSSLPQISTRLFPPCPTNFQFSFKYHPETFWKCRFLFTGLRWGPRSAVLTMVMLMRWSVDQTWEFKTLQIPSRLVWKLNDYLRSQSYELVQSIGFQVWALKLPVHFYTLLKILTKQKQINISIFTHVKLLTWMGPADSRALPRCVQALFKQCMS